jgi:hypothetical protein
MVATDVAAEKATELPRLGKPRMKLNVQASHTGTTPQDRQTSKGNSSAFFVSGQRKDGPVRIGERHRWSTLCRYLEPGIAPSRLKAYIIREFDVTEKVLRQACNDKART